MTRQPDPVLVHARREGILITVVWVVCTIYCCAYCYLYGYIRPGQELGPDDVHPTFGMPSWVFWGVMVPWGLCALFTFWFTGVYMTDDELGKDHTDELMSDIREGAGA